MRLYIFIAGGGTVQQGKIKNITIGNKITYECASACKNDPNDCTYFEMYTHVPPWWDKTLEIGYQCNFFNPTTEMGLGGGNALVIPKFTYSFIAFSNVQYNIIQFSCGFLKRNMSTLSQHFRVLQSYGNITIRRAHTRRTVRRAACSTRPQL